MTSVGGSNNVQIQISQNECLAPFHRSRNRLNARLMKIIPWGAHYRAELAWGDSRLVALILRPSFLELELHEGNNVVASFKATAVHVIKRK